VLERKIYLFFIENALKIAMKKPVAKMLQKGFSLLKRNCSSLF